MPAADITAKVKAADGYTVNYVGIELTLDGFAVKRPPAIPAAFAAAIEAVRAASHRPLILIADDPAVMAAGLNAFDGEAP